MEKQVSEGSLHKWFKGSKSKDGKGGWVNVVTGGTCASDEPGEGTPKCVSSAKRASMTKAERLSAARRKKKADPGQQQKSGAAKPTYVSTDKPKKKKMKETYERSLTPLTEKAKKCWPGYEKKGTKKMFGKTYNNCVKKEEVVYSEAKIDEKDPKNKRERRNIDKFGPQTKPYDPDTKEMKTSMSKYMQGMRKKMHDSKRGRKTRGPDAGMRTEAVNAAQQAAIAIAKRKKKEDDMVAMKKKKQKVYSEDNEMTELEMQKNAIKTGMMNGKKLTDKQIEGLKAGLTQGGNKIEEGLIEEGDKKGKGSGTKDACYHKVKSRYSVWPSAYASGALVKCRKVGAANWGNSSKKEDFSDWKSEFIWEDGDSSKKLEEDKSPAWQRKEGKSESGGLNAKGVASYRRENPGSKLKTAVTAKPSTLKRGSKSAKRRKSFCSRMKGMKKKLTSAKTARDPDSRINKALRKWNC